MGPYYQAFPEGGSLTIYEDDEARTYDEIARWSKKDAEAWPKWNAWLAGIADVMGPLLTRVPPDDRQPLALRPRRPRQAGLENRGVDARMVADITRLMSMSIADLLDDWFESPQVKGALAVNGVIGTWAGPYAPGTAYVMAHHSIGDVGDGAAHRAGSWGYPEGGMGAVSAAIAASARVVRRRDPHQRARRVGQHQQRPGRRAWCSRTARSSRAPLVVTSLHPKIAFLEHLPRDRACPTTSSRDIERWNTRSAAS